MSEAKAREDAREAAEPQEEDETSSAVIQFQLPPYGQKELFGDYQELNLLFAYSTLFVICCPPVALLSFVLLYVEIRVDAFKMLHSVRIGIVLTHMIRTHSDIPILLMTSLKFFQ